MSESHDGKEFEATWTHGSLCLCDDAFENRYLDWQGRTSVLLSGQEHNNNPLILLALRLRSGCPVNATGIHCSGGKRQAGS